MPIIKNDNNTMQVEFGAGDVIPLTLGVPTPEGKVLPAVVIMPMHEAMELTKSQRKFTDFDIRLIFDNENQIQFMIGQLEHALKIVNADKVEEEKDEVKGEEE